MSSRMAGIMLRLEAAGGFAVDRQSRQRLPTIEKLPRTQLPTRRAPMTARAVHWHEGMFLRPQQFQAAERHAHELLARTSRWDVHHGWGVHRVEWEPEALATYR